jgi:hypothetical protein
MSDMSDFRFLRVLLLKLAMGSSSVSEGQGGSTRVGSRSLAPRACILDAPKVMRFWAMALVLMVGTGGANSGEGPLIESRPRDLGRRIVDARRSFCGLMKLELPSRGAVCGVSGVEGVGGILPLTRASYVFFEGLVMAILARASFIEIDRNRLCGAGLMIGDDESLLEVS